MAIFKVYDGSDWVEVPILDGAPGGELGGTWAVPTVDATHSGSAHHTESHKARHAAGGADLLFSEHTYVFVPDAAQGVNIGTGDQQGLVHHSGDNQEEVIAWYIDAETAPTGAAIIVQLEYGDTDDLDTVASWTEIDRDNLAISAKSVKYTTGFTTASIPANRLIRMNVDQVGSTVVGQDGAVHLRVQRRLQT